MSDDGVLCLQSCLMTVFFLEPNNESYQDLYETLKVLKAPVDMEPLAPPGVDHDVYHELFCVVQMLRPNDLFPIVSWLEMRYAR